jgi:CRP-like cAMP-binding protein
MTSANLNLFSDADEYMDFNPREVIFSQGAPGDAMYVVIEGLVDIVVGNRVIESVGMGGIFGEMALIDHADRSAAAVAQTSCKVVRIDEPRFLFMVQQTPGFAVTVMQIMAERLRNMNQKL